MSRNLRLQKSTQQSMGSSRKCWCGRFDPFRSVIDPLKCCSIRSLKRVDWNELKTQLGRTNTNTRRGGVSERILEWKMQAKEWIGENSICRYCLHGSFQSYPTKSFSPAVSRSGTKKPSIAGSTTLGGSAPAEFWNLQKRPLLILSVCCWDWSTDRSRAQPEIVWDKTTSLLLHLPVLLSSNEARTMVMLW